MKLIMDWLSSIHWLSWIGFSLVTAGGILTLIGNSISDNQAQKDLKKEVNAKHAEIDSIRASNERISKSNEKLIVLNSQAIENNSQLIFKVGQYQKNIEERDKKIQELEISVKKAKRGISTSKNFNGSHSIKDGSSTGIATGTDDEKTFNQIIRLYEKKEWQKMIALCEQSIKSSPDWYTAYIYKAIALLNINASKYQNDAIDLLAFVEENTVGDAEYMVALSELYAQMGYINKSKDMLKSVDKDQLARFVNKQKK